MVSITEVSLEEVSPALRLNSRGSLQTSVSFPLKWEGIRILIRQDPALPGSFQREPLSLVGILLARSRLCHQSEKWLKGWVTN